MLVDHHTVQNSYVGVVWAGKQSKWTPFSCASSFTCANAWLTWMSRTGLKSGLSNDSRRISDCNTKVAAGTHWLSCSPFFSQSYTVHISVTLWCKTKISYCTIESVWVIWYLYLIALKIPQIMWWVAIFPHTCTYIHADLSLRGICTLVVLWCLYMYVGKLWSILPQECITHVANIVRQANPFAISHDCGLLAPQLACKSLLLLVSISCPMRPFWWSSPFFSSCEGAGLLD